MYIFLYTRVTDLAGEVIGHLGGVQDILMALRTHPNNAKLCSTCLSALWGLTVHGTYLFYVGTGPFRFAFVPESCNNVKFLKNFLKKFLEQFLENSSSIPIDPHHTAILLRPFVSCGTKMQFSMQMCLIYEICSLFDGLIIRTSL